MIHHPTGRLKQPVAGTMPGKTANYSTSPVCPGESFSRMAATSWLSR